MIEEALIIGVVASGVRMSIPILFAALGECIAERSGVLNLGVEGMMIIGAFAGFMGTYLTGNIAIGLLMAMGGAAVLASLMAFLSVTIRTNQLAAGLAIWLLGVGLAALLYRLSFGVVTIAPSIQSFDPINIPFLSQIPIAGPILFNHDPMIYLAILMIPVTHIFLFRTNLGLKIGGAFAGLGGAYLSLVITGSFSENITGGQGWIALAVVIFGRWRPFWIVLGALIFGMVNSFQLGLQATGTTIPFQFLLMLPYILPIAILAATYRKSVAPAALTIPYTRGER
jgi:general nucleoside transport system permease protein